MFRSDVRRAGGETEERVYGTTVYDRTAMSARKDRPCLVLQTQKGALQVRVENSLPFLLGCTSAASVADKHMLPDLLHGEERKVWGDGAYRGKERRSGLFAQTTTPEAKTPNDLPRSGLRFCE